MVPPPTAVTDAKTNTPNKSMPAAMAASAPAGGKHGYTGEIEQIQQAGHTVWKWICE